MTAQKVADIIFEMAPRSGEVTGDANAFLYGSPDTVITGVTVCWTPSADVMRQTAGLGCNLILSHEMMFFPRSTLEWYGTIPEPERPHNIVRKELMDRFGLCHCRCHSNWDCIATHGIADACATLLGFPEPVYRSRFLRMYELPAQTVGQLAEHCKARLGVPHVRVGGDLARLVTKVGIAYGGFGQSWECLDEFILQGAEAVILGEAIDYTFRAAIDADLAVIETSHVGSENPGMREFARLLAEKLLVPVKFIDSGHPWVLR